MIKTMAGFLTKHMAAIARALVGAVMMAALLAVIFIAVERSSVSFEDDYAYAGAVFEPMSFDALDGWRRDDASASLSAFLLSCETLKGRRNDEPFNRHEKPGARAFDVGAGSLAGLVEDWRPICLDAQRLVNRAYVDRSVLASAARQFFETRFTPVRIKTAHTPIPGGPAAGRAPVFETVGKATGYFEPVYKARARKTRTFSAPLLALPDDLVSVDLGAFDDTLAGRRVAGRVEDGRLRPYPSRSDINAGALSGRATPLAYLRPNDLFFLQIQGSGRLMINGRGEVRVGYAGQNGRPYYAIGRSLIRRGALTRENVTMQSIRAWLDNAGPQDAQNLREENPSYVFFRVLSDLPDPSLGPLGAQGVQLTGGRSVAVDRAYHPLGAPIWIEPQTLPASEVDTSASPGASSGPAASTSNGDENAAAPAPPLSKGALYVAQDVGGAIKGAIRADIFVGRGAEAGLAAGGMNEPIAMTVLLPKAVAARLSDGAPAS